MNIHKITLFLSICFCFLICCISSCGSKTVPQKSGVHYKMAKDQTLSVTSSGEGNNKEDALEKANQNAFEVLLFRGIPGSPYAKPLIPIAASQAKASHSAFFKEFYDNKAYKKFITQHSVLSAGSRNKQTKLIEAAVDITINVASLKRELEQQNIIKKFGF